jgi:hypothetical protein
MKSTPMHPSIGDRLQFIAIGPRDLLLKLICMSYRSFIWAFSKLPPRYMAWTSRMRAKRALFRAVRHVPAYAKFLESRGATRDMIPETDKDSYIKAFPVKMRCLGGQRKHPKFRLMRQGVWHSPLFSLTSSCPNHH